MKPRAPTRHRRESLHRATYPLLAPLPSGPYAPVSSGLTPTLVPCIDSTVSDAPSTKRSDFGSAFGVMFPRVSAAELVSVLRTHVNFLESMLGTEVAPCARDTLLTIQSTIERLEYRVRSGRPR